MTQKILFAICLALSTNAAQASNWKCVDPKNDDRILEISLDQQKIEKEGTWKIVQKAVVLTGSPKNSNTILNIYPSVYERTVRCMNCWSYVIGAKSVDAGAPSLITFDIKKSEYLAKTTATAVVWAENGFLEFDRTESLDCTQK